MILKEEPGTFAADVDKTLTALGSAAKTAAGKFGDAKKKAEDDLKKASDREKKIADAKAALAAKKSAAVGARKMAASAGIKTSGSVNTNRALLANFLISLDALPTIEDMAAFDDLDASQFQDFIAELSKVEDELIDFPKEFKSLLKGSNFLTAPERTNDAMDEITQAIENEKVDSLNKSIELNPSNLRGALQAVIYDPTLNTTGRVVLTWLNNRNQENKKFNQSKAMGNNRPTGPQLARIFNAYVQQVIVPRIEALSVLAIDYENKPITQEHLSALRSLLKLL